MKRILILLLLLIVVLEGRVKMKQKRNLSFGKGYPGQSLSVTIPNNCATANANTNIGKVQLDHTNKDKYTSVTIDWTTPTELDDGGGNAISFTNSEAWCDDSTTGTIQDITDWGSGSYTGLGTNNKYHNMYFGGSISIPVNAPTGMYSGTISITLTY